MFMKKLFLVVTAMLCIATASAQDKWSVGLRLGTGAQVEGEYFYSDKAYLEGLLGFSFVGGNVDFSVIHNWNCFEWDWTPSAGHWCLDAGVGGRIGGSGDCCFFGVAGQAKFGIEFKKVPIRLAFDVTPSFGPIIHYGKKVTMLTGDGNEMVEASVKIPSTCKFFSSGLLSLGISATWRF